MSTSRNRRPRTPSRRRAHTARPPRFDARRAEVTRWMPLLHETDDAELRGDAGRALQLMAGHLLDEAGRPFWRAERLRRLTQLVALGPVLPSWATSRWVVAQAAQHLDPDTQSAHRDAVEAALAARGVSDEVRRRQAGWAHTDVRTRIMDHDWIHHQLLLFDLGALAHFVRHAATPDLLAGADDLERWIEAPMNGFRLLEQDAAAIRWRDLATDRAVVTPNLGAAALIRPGDHVVGRLVPSGDTWLFESEPLGVPEHTALRVAADPETWVDALAEVTDARVPDVDRVLTDSFDFSLLSDVPQVAQLICAVAASRRRRPANPFVRKPAPALDELTARVDLVLGAVQDPTDADPAGVATAPLVAAQLVEPAVLDALRGLCDESELRGLEEYAATLAAPARDAVALFGQESSRAS